MGYFDYLDENKKSKAGKEHHNYDPFVKSGTFVWFGALGITIISVILMIVCWPLGKSIWLDIFLVLGFGTSVTAVALCGSAKRMASRLRQESQLGNCIFIWGIFLALLNLIFVGLNTYLFFV